MRISQYTVVLKEDEMFDLAYALENYISGNLSLDTPAKRDDVFNDFERELELLQTFVDNGYRLNISKKTPEGHSIWETNPKLYQNAEDWLKDLLRQRRKEVK